MTNDPLNLHYWYSQGLKNRKEWYSYVSEYYHLVRPSYPSYVIEEVISFTGLKPPSRLLEIGCGPAVLTLPFARLGYSLHCLEPNVEFYTIAKEFCQDYALVSFENIALEEWEVEKEKFEGVICANSFHWLPPSISYQTIHQALRKTGYLILLWNMTPEPDYQVYQLFQGVYEQYAPALVNYEGEGKQAEVLRLFGENIRHSGLFNLEKCSWVKCSKVYAGEEYLLLLNTLSIYRKVESEYKDMLFQGLLEIINNDLGGKVEVFYLSGFQIALPL